MNSDDVLAQYEQEQQSKRLLERCSDECLACADLAAEGLSPAASGHIVSCERCRTLREKLRRIIDAGDDGLAGDVA